MPVDAGPARPGALVRSGLALAGVALFFTNLDSFAFSLHAAPPPTRWAIAFAGAAALLVITNPSRPAPVLRSSLAWWVAFYFLLTTSWAVFMRNLPEVSQELYDRYRSIAFLVALALIFDDPRARRVGVIAVAACVVFASLLNIAETLSLVTFADPNGLRTPGRSSGLYLNPNASGLAIVLGAAVVTERLPRPLRTPLLLVCAFGTAATFSRGALICLGVVLAWLAWRRALGGWYFVLAAVGTYFLFLYSVDFLRTHDLLNENTAARLQFTHDDSGRVALAERSWRMFQSAPLLGNGLASTIAWNEPVRAHNMFLTLAADHGLLGLLAFPALGLALVKSNRGAACFAIGLMAAGFFGHGLLEDRYALLLAALAAAKDPAPASTPEQDQAPDGDAPSLGGGLRAP